MNKEIDFRGFPTTRYQGSKRKILPWIYEVLKDVEFETVLDAFGGTASVSYLFKKMNKSITYNDKFKFNYLIGKALIENKNTKLNENDINIINSNNEGFYYYDFIQKNFKDIYYLQKENKWLDHIISNIIQMNHYSDKVLQYKKALAYYSLFQACLMKRPYNLFHRKNLSLRINNVARTFGNKSTWDKPFDDLLNRSINEVNDLVFTSDKKCKAINKSVFDIKETGYDLVYLDPPYIRRKRTNDTSDYLKCYHFLEGISQYRTWGNYIDFDTINLRFKTSLSNDDFTKTKIKTSFERLFDIFSDSIIVVSYKCGGYPSIDYLIKLLNKFKGKVYSRSKPYIYALNHQNGDAKNNREVLIIGV